MRKTLNFINPSEAVINKINIYNFTNSVSFNYLISDFPHRSADILFISSSMIHICRDYREFSYIPFIVYGDSQFIEKSFAVGAADFIKNPWSFNEIEIRAVRYINKDKLFINNIEIQFSNSSIQNSEYTLPMTVNEYKILSLLSNNLDKIISKENIYYKIGVKNDKSRVIDTYIHSIKKKINQLTNNKDKNILAIRTIKNRGYIINSQFGCG
ncbi:MAG: response regulator transcription factor [Spirochaetaceae bacterium]|nr:response regulator transcription factor [Spirochaetaceae bacterium]